MRRENFYSSRRSTSAYREIAPSEVDVLLVGATKSGAIGVGFGNSIGVGFDGAPPHPTISMDHRNGKVRVRIICPWILCVGGSSRIDMICADVRDQGVVHGFVMFADLSEQRHAGRILIGCEPECACDHGDDSMIVCAHFFAEFIRSVCHLPVR